MQYDLVFEGGGAKGIVFAGAMEAFEEEGHTYDRLLGASVGAISATLLAAGYDVAELKAALSEKEDGRPTFIKFLGEPEAVTEAQLRESVLTAFLQDVDIPGIPEALERRLENWVLGRLMGQTGFRHIYSLIERAGWYSAEAFLDWLRTKLDSGDFKGQQRQFSQMTLAEFFEATGRDLSLIGSDTTDARMLILNHRTAPELPLVYAVRMSMSFPLLWQEVVWHADWGPYRGKDLTGHAIVDGGLLSNFPIELFVSTQPYVLDVMGPKTASEVLGFLIDESIEVPNAPPKPDEKAVAGGPSVIGRIRALSLIKAMVDTVTQAHDKMVIDAFAEMVVRLPAKTYGTTEFDMTDERRLALMAAGKTMMSRYFRRQEMISFAAPAEPATAEEIADRLAGRMLE